MIPNTMNLSLYGTLIHYEINKSIIRKANSSLTYIIESFSDKNIVKIFNGNFELLCFTNYKKDNLTSFTRIVGNKSYIYHNGELKLSLYNKNLTTIIKLKKKC
jgi:hypothetical protein